MSHVLIKLSPFNEKQRNEILAELQKFNGRLKLQYSNRILNSIFIRDFENIDKNKVDSWKSKLEKKYKLILPNNSITIIAKKG